MTESIQLGIPGLSVPQGTHLCGFFRGREERGDIVFPFVREALRSGDKCLCAYEATDRDALHAEVIAEVQVASVSDQLDIVPSRDVYLGAGRVLGRGHARLLGDLGGNLAGRRKILLRSCRR
jgi:DcmR-like sensory protein